MSALSVLSVHRKSFFVCAIFAACTLQVFSESPPVVGAEHEIEQLIQGALLRSPALEMVEGEAKSVKAEESHLSHWEDPEMRLGYGRDTNVSSQLRSSRYPSHAYDASLRLFPKNPWEVRAVRKKLRAESRLVELSKQDVSAELSAEVRSLYWDFCYTRANATLLQQFVAIRKEQNEGMEILLNSGQVTLEQHLAAQMKQINTVMKLEALKQNEREMLGELSRLTGVEKAAIRVSEPSRISEDAFQFPFQQWKALALKNRLELNQYDAEIAHAKAEIEAIKAGDILWVKHIEGSYLVRNDYGDRDSYGVEVAFSIPLFSPRDGRKEMAAATLNSQERARFYGVKIIEVEVSNLIDDFIAMEAQWSAHTSGMAPMVDTLRSSVEAMEEQGNNHNRSYWDAKVGLLELEMNELQYAWQYQKLQLLAASVLGEAI